MCKLIDDERERERAGGVEKGKGAKEDGEGEEMRGTRDEGGSKGVWGDKVIIFTA